MSDCGPPSSAFARYRQSFNGEGLAFVAGILMTVGAVVAFWTSGFRSAGPEVQIPFFIFFVAYLLHTVRKLRAIGTFELVMDPDGEGLVLDGVPMAELGVSYRGRLVFLRFRPVGVRMVWLGNASRRREFKLALVHWNTTLRNQSMAP